MKNFKSAFSGIKQDEARLLAQIQEKLEYIYQDVQIFDHSLTSVLHKGKFIGIIRFGHAKLHLSDGSVIDVMEGRMRPLSYN